MIRKYGAYIFQLLVHFLIVQTIYSVFNWFVLRVEFNSLVKIEFNWFQLSSDVKIDNRIVIFKFLPTFLWGCARVI